MAKHIVTQDAVRPARPDGTCFYCRAPLGAEHETGCVLRRRPVVVRVSFDLVVDVPEDWNRDTIDFMYGENICADNIVRQVAEAMERVQKRAEAPDEDTIVCCMCESQHSGEYVREATDRDILLQAFDKPA